jgi:hypothetical protein
MRSFLDLGRAVVLAGGVLAVLAGPLSAQVMPGEPPPGSPPPPGAPAFVPPAGEGEAIHSYLCMQRRIGALRAQMLEKTQALDGLRRRLAALNAELERAHRHVDVNNPQSVARYKALLERRDTLAEHSWRPAVIAARQATFRYNAAVRAYNARYANRPYDAVLVAQIRANLSCGPAR